MTIALLLLALLFPARAEQVATVHRGTLSVRVRVTGTVVPADIVRLKATIDGRVEDIFVPTGGWGYEGHPIGQLANREMAALLDAHSTTEKGVLEERWRQVYRPTDIECPKACYVMRTFIKPKDWVKARALLFEASQELRLVARVRPEDAKWVHDGQIVEFWDVQDPKRKQRGQVTHFILDVQGQKVAPGGSFFAIAGPDHFLPPGTTWEGEIVALIKHDVLIAPTDALISYGDSVYLPVKISTGITTATQTEISAGTEAGRDVLVVDDSRLKDAAKHKPQANPDEIIRAQETQVEAPVEVEPKKDSGPLPDPDAVYGGDPYGQ